MKYFVYILKCNDDSFYVGVTNDILKRFAEHESGNNPKSYTFYRRPLQLVYYKEFESVEQAISFEKQLKGWSRKKKIALIEGKFEDLPNLAKKKFEKK